MVNDVKQAFFYAPATRPIYIGLPAEAKGPDDVDVCGRLERSLYGTRDAALNWSLQYTRVLESIGFKKGASSPCTFHHPGRGVCMAVHGDDFVSEGQLSDLQWVDQQLRAHFQIKTELMGAQEGLTKELRLLNRILQWAPEGIYWEPDPRHVELTLRDLNLDQGQASSQVTPGVKPTVVHRALGSQDGATGWES